jgi:hypothetical protein
MQPNKISATPVSKVKTFVEAFVELGERICTTPRRIYTGYEVVPTTELDRKNGEQDWHLRMYSTETIALALSYFCVGVATNFISTPVDYYMIDTLNANSAEVNVLSTVQLLPWCLKFVFGLISDSVPIGVYVYV